MIEWLSKRFCCLIWATNRYCWEVGPGCDVRAMRVWREVAKGWPCTWL